MQGEKVETDVRLRSALDKCDAVAALVGLLSGLRVLNATPDLVQLQLSTCCPAGAVQGRVQQLLVPAACSLLLHSWFRKGTGH